MIKISVIIGTRPEIIKLSCIIQELEKYSNLSIIHTGQNYDYELNELFFKQLKIRKPNFFLNAIKGTPSETIGDIISKTDKVLRSINPDAVLIYGDTNSCLSVIAAKKRKIPIFHMEAGNRCFDQRVPEEVNRKIVDHISDINMPLTEHARRYLVSEGIKPETVIKIGSPMLEVLNKNRNSINKNSVLTKEKLKKNKYFLMSIHREENLDHKDNLKNLLESISAISEFYNLPIIISTHPRTKKKLSEISYINKDKNIKFAKPFGFFEYVKLQINAFCVISDSGTITEESSLLNFPAITIRNAHERPEGMDEGVLIMSGLKKNQILNSINIVTSQFKDDKSTPTVSDYNTDNVSKKVVRIIYSYVHYVRRTVWNIT